MIPTSAQRKFARGVEHIKTLGWEADTFNDGSNYEFRVEREPRAPNHVEYRCFAIERQPLPDHWPLLAGEAVQNLRSALDHAVYAVAGRSKSQFPIFTNPDDFQARSKDALRGVPEAMRATIERAQPYNRAPKNPRRARLAVLNALSNLDKHRVLAVVASATRLEYVGTREDIEITWQMIATERQLGHGETHISTFVATAETEIEEVDVHPGFDYEIRIEGRPLNLLIGVARRVYEVLAQVETGEPLSPLAPYPI